MSTTVLDVMAKRSAINQYDRARREHQKALLTGTDQPLMHTFAYRSLVRFDPSETAVVKVYR